MKSHVKLFTTVLREAGQNCGVSTLQDEKYILRRLSQEGDSFLTITLPAYEKSLLTALDVGRITSDHFDGFHRRGGLPSLFSGFLRIIFDNHGFVRDTSPELILALRMLRQVLLLLSKVEWDAAPERELRVLTQFRITDEEIPTFTREDSHLLGELQSAFRLLFTEYLQGVENGLYNDPFFRGNHGPGAVADKRGNNRRWSNTVWTERLESVFRAESTLACNLHDYIDTEYTWLPIGQEPPVRVVTVPKTMKGPRVIAIEPVHTQYVQQGLLNLLSEHLDMPANAIVKDRLGWRDQVPNRDLSRDHVNFSTIDLSEASDRVPLQLVEFLFEDFPLLRSAILASRSQTAELPNGEVITLKKFASMGSALCFPIESMIFATCVVMAHLRYMDGHGARARSRSAIRNIGDIPVFRVFGDDIVVQKNVTPTLIRVLESFGLKVNTAKSFWTGKFRESCGADWYDGHDVSVNKVRCNIPAERGDTTELIRSISLHNRLFEAGMFESAQYVEQALLRVRPMYYAAPGSKALALWTYDESRVIVKQHGDYHRPVIKAFTVSYIYREDYLDDYGALRKFFFSRKAEWSSPWDTELTGILRRSKGIDDPDHLRYSGRPLRVTINAGYVGP